MRVEPGGDLLDRFVRGDQQAFESLFRHFEREVYRWIVRIVRERDAAEDVLVETFWRAYRSRALFDPARPLGAWLRRIATNAALDHLKAVRREPAWVPAGDDLPAPAGRDAGLDPAIERAFRELPLKLRVVATLALVEEQPLAEIADALDLPMGTVKSRLFRATRILREELARLGIRP